MTDINQQIPQHILDDIANQKPRGKWYYRWQKVREFWHALFDKYFITRCTIVKPGKLANADGPMEIGEMGESVYYNLAEGKFYDSPKNATVVGFITGALAVCLLRRKSKNEKHEFSLIPLPELAFINHITGRDKEGATKEDFR